MEISLLIDNLSNPALLFFFLGVIATRLKSDLEIPLNTSKFISLYLLLAIGFKGGQELAHSELNASILWQIIFGVLLSVIVPLYTFFILRKKFSIQNAGAIAAAYGSVSAVTFVTAISFLDLKQIVYGGQMVAIMAVMEAPAIIVGVLLVSMYDKEGDKKTSLGSLIKHSFTNGSVVLILGSLVIGFLASEKHAEGIKPFTTEIFKGFLAVFLLDMGLQSGKNIFALVKKGWYPFAFAIVIPFVNGCIVAFISHWITPVIGNQLLFAILAASASYIAVPAAMKIALPKSDSAIYLPMALGITFPFNITIGLPVYYFIISAVN